MFREVQLFDFFIYEIIFSFFFNYLNIQILVLFFFFNFNAPIFCNLRNLMFFEFFKFF